MEIVQHDRKLRTTLTVTKPSGFHPLTLRLNDDGIPSMEHIVTRDKAIELVRFILRAQRISPIELETQS